MSGFSLPQTIAIALTFFLAGAVKGIAGMGLPTVAMGLLGTIMPPVSAAALLIVPSFVTNVWQLFSGPSFKALAFRFWPMLAGMTAGTLLGAGIIAGHNGWTVAALGGALVLYALLGLLSWQPSVPAGAERTLSPIVGLATGFVTGGTGLAVIPAVPYLQALDLFRDDLIQALGLAFTVSSAALAVGLASRGAFHLDDAAASAVVLAPALLGMEVGKRIRQRISLAAFRRWFLIFMLLLGFELVLRSFF